MSYISNYLKETSAKKSIRASEMAEYVGISQNYLSYVKAGKKTFKYETWRKIIEFLELNQEETIEAWEAWNYDRMSPEMIKRVEELKEENKQLRNLVDAIKFLNK